MASSASGPLTCSKDFSPASLPTVLMSSNTALLACCWKTRKVVRKLAAVNKNLGLFFWGGGYDSLDSGTALRRIQRSLAL